MVTISRCLKNFVKLESKLCHMHPASIESNLGWQLKGFSIFVVKRRLRRLVSFSCCYCWCRFCLRFDLRCYDRQISQAITLNSNYYYCWDSKIHLHFVDWALQLARLMMVAHWIFTTITNSAYSVATNYYCTEQPVEAIIVASEQMLITASQPRY